jgi:hypothetical protein
MATSISKKRKFVADGVFRAELGEFFTRELSEEGYSGCEVRVTHARTEVRHRRRLISSPIDLFLLSTSDRLTFNRRQTDHYPRNAHAGGAGRERKAHSRAHIARPEAVQVPRGLARALRRKGPPPWSLCRRTM